MSERQPSERWPSERRPNERWPNERRPSSTAAVPTAEAMRDIGLRLAELVGPGDLLVLSGDLGAGKTTLTQGLGEGLKVRGPITSPTFVIARIHPSLCGGPPLVHVDAYRLGGFAELDDLDLDADLDVAVTVVEWGEGLAEGLSEDRLEIMISRAHDESSQQRQIRLTGVGDRWQNTSFERLFD